jgi:phosphate transport system protein
MARETIKMVTDSVDSFVHRDIEAAREVEKYDDVVDGLFTQVKTELTALVAEDGENAEMYLDLLMVAKYFERIGDHATNIAEWVEYSVTGKHENTP